MVFGHCGVCNKNTQSLLPIKYCCFFLKPNKRLKCCFHNHINTIELMEVYVVCKIWYICFGNEFYIEPNRKHIAILLLYCFYHNYHTNLPVGSTLLFYHRILLYFACCLELNSVFVCYK